jgi:glucose/arabinose dehydrogenase
MNARIMCGLLIAGVVAITMIPARGATPACDPDNGGIKLPEGFCALVAADGLGTARHMAVAPNGDVYVATMARRPGTTALWALRDTDGDGRFDVKEGFGEVPGGTGIALRNGYLYVAAPARVIRYKMAPGQLKPMGEPEVVVSGLMAKGQHEDKGIAFDGKGGLYVNVGAPSNACQQPDRRPGVKGQDPCPLLEMHGGIWKFDENKLGQAQTPEGRYATGMRQMPAITWAGDSLFVLMNNRDQLEVFWPDLFKTEDNVNRPAEPLYKVAQGDDYGWPYCYFDYPAQKLVLNPEYGGDGKEVGRCANFKQPAATYPAHWAPVDIMFYTGTQFPQKYRNGAFIAFHGSWNRAPQPQDGYNVTFQPFAGGKPSGKFEIFANNFAGQDPLMNPNQAAYRADGVAQAPDGSLYIADSQKGRVWRVLYSRK